MNNGAEYGDENVDVSISDAHVAMDDSRTNAHHLDTLDKPGVDFVEQLSIQLGPYGTCKHLADRRFCNAIPAAFPAIVKQQVKNGKTYKDSTFYDPNCRYPQILMPGDSMLESMSVNKDNLTTIVKEALSGPRNTQGIECYLGSWVI